jgi:RNA polymerase sigma factor (sigma-70 family)
VNDEADLIGRVQRGDLKAYEGLVRLYESVAFRTAFLILHDPHDAADIVQDAFVRAYQSIATFQIDKSFRPWLLRIVTNLSLNRVRSSQRRSDATQRLTRQIEAKTEPSLDLVVVTLEQSERLLQAVAKLATEDQVLISLRYFVDLTENEIAETLQIPIGTVKSRLHRTLTRLREIIQRDFPDVDEWTGEP